MHPRQLIAISGPTGIGKTKVAIELAKRINAEIISFDSRQIYQELNIGVARPNILELREVQHHLIAHKSIHDKYSAQDFVNDFQKITNNEQQITNSYILVGGTGFFLYALEHGLDELPDISEETRNRIQFEFDKKGLEYLQNKVKEIDPESYRTMEITNPRRLQRILEIWEETGEVYSELISRKDAKAHFNSSIKNIVLDIPREILYERIERRVDEMIEDGLIEEVKGLYPHRHLNALNTVGYKELFDFFEGKCNLNEAIDKIKQHTRNYAKRQITWNKKYLKDATWINPLETTSENILKSLITT